MTASNDESASDGVIEGELVPFEPPVLKGRPRLYDAETRARLVDRADRMNVEQGWGLRKIAAQFTTEGYPVSYVTLMRWLNEARSARPWIESIKRDDQRVGQLGRFEWYLQMIRERIEQGADVLDAMPHILAIEREIRVVAGTAAPKQIETKDMTERPQAAPDEAMLRALARLRETDREDER